MSYWDANTKIIRDGQVAVLALCLNRFFSEKAIIGAFSVIVKTSRTFVSSSNEDGGCCAARSYVLTIAITWPSACRRAGLVTAAGGHIAHSSSGHEDNSNFICDSWHPLHSAVHIYIFIRRVNDIHSQCCSNKHTTTRYLRYMICPWYFTPSFWCYDSLSLIIIDFKVILIFSSIEELVWRHKNKKWR